MLNMFSISMNCSRTIHKLFEGIFIIIPTSHYHALFGKEKIQSKEDLIKCTRAMYHMNHITSSCTLEHPCSENHNLIGRLIC
jgi:hypothetical protein